MLVLACSYRPLPLAHSPQRIQHRFPCFSTQSAKTHHLSPVFCILLKMVELPNCLSGNFLKPEIRVPGIEAGRWQTFHSQPQACPSFIPSSANQIVGYTFICRTIVGCSTCASLVLALWFSGKAAGAKRPGQNGRGKTAGAKRTGQNGRGKAAGAKRTGQSGRGKTAWSGIEKQRKQ